MHPSLLSPSSQVTCALPMGFPPGTTGGGHCRSREQLARGSRKAAALADHTFVLTSTSVAVRPQQHQAHRCPVHTGQGGRKGGPAEREQTGSDELTGTLEDWSPGRALARPLRCDCHSSGLVAPWVWPLHGQILQTVPCVFLPTVEHL